jgi:DMSO/TMAO reductase YedYZ molybdopterin-dependent catalytic subunit
MKNSSNSNEKPRLPPGQHIISKFPVLQKGIVAHINRETYNLEVVGEIENPMAFSIQDLKKLKDKDVIVDIHCVTTWSKFDTRWGGISFKKLLDLVKPKATANFVEFYCADEGFTTTIPLDTIYKENTILALTYEGVPINDKHGGPVRPIIPDLYFYKSAKWVTRITFLEKDKLGYWERAGYSNKANPWQEQRRRSDD